MRRCLTLGLFASSGLLAANLSVNPDNLNFTAIPGSSPQSKNSTLRNTGASTNFTCSDDRPWLSVSPTSGSINQNSNVNLTITFNPAGFHNGDNGNGTVTCSGGGSSAQISVGFGINGAEITLNPGSVTLSAVVGDRTSAQINVNAINGNTPISAAIQSGGSWLTVQQGQGTTPTSFTITADATGLTTGTLNGIVVVTCTGGLPCVPKAVSVSFQVTPNTPVLSVSQSGFSFSTNFGSTTPQQTTVVLRNDGLPTNFTIATQSTPAWLTVTPTSGSIGQNQTVQLTVKGDPTGLSAPTYSGTITINSGAPSPVVIKVAFNIQGGSTLSVDQPALSLNANVGSNLTQTAQVNVMNAGASTSFTAAPQVASTWLSISPASGTIAASSSQALAITVNPGSLAAGTYTAIVNVTVSGTVAATFTVKFAVSALGAVSSADYAAGLTPGTIGAVFALGITNTTQSATGLVLPNSIAGVFLTIKDSAGKQFQVGLFFVSPGQVNFEVPETAATGPATLTVQNPQGIVASGTVQIVAVAPSLYTADASGTGPPAALVLFYDGNGNFQKYTLAASCDSSNHCTPAPIDVHAAPLMFLQLYGTGIRNRSDISKVSCNMGGIILSADYAGSQNTFPGLDQVNIKLPLSLAGKGTFSLVLTVDGIATKPVQVTFQ